MAEVMASAQEATQNAVTNENEARALVEASGEAGPARENLSSNASHEGILTQSCSSVFAFGRLYHCFFFFPISFLHLYFLPSLPLSLALSTAFPS